MRIKHSRKTKTNLTKRQKNLSIIFQMCPEKRPFNC